MISAFLLLALNKLMLTGVSNVTGYIFYIYLLEASRFDVMFTKNNQLCGTCNHSDVTEMSSFFVSVLGEIASNPQK